MIEPERWARIQSLFHRALEHPPEARGAWLDTVDAPEEERTPVREMLASVESGDAFLAALFGAPGGEEDGLPLPSRIDRYRVLRALGRGGSGDVYLAVRDDAAFQKRVALKVLRGEIRSTATEARFRRERQILAALEHPAIARLLDGGTTEEGAPFLVLEHVEGQPIDRFCASHRLPVEARLRLFRSVCEAVQYAHQNLVLHCDLKPANLLVTAAGQPKLLDFGIARLLNPELTAAEPLPGAPERRPLTPAFASPEQVNGGPLTTASDVYALGALLYTMLAGRPPHAVEGLPRPEVARILGAERPRPVSEAAREGAANPAVPWRALRGDLDAIVEKALAREPGQRYGSVEALAADLRRHLEHLPVLARPPRWSYRLPRFVRRNRGWVAAGLVLALLGAALALQSGRLARERDRVVREREQAELQKERAEEVSSFLLELFEAADPDLRAGGDPTVREILHRSAEGLERELADQPLLRARLYETLGSVHRKLGDYDTAGELLRRALDLRQAALPREAPETADALEAYAGLLCEAGRGREALPLFGEALTIRRRSGGAPLAATLVEVGLLQLELGEMDPAEASLEEALELYRVALGPRSVAVAETLVALGKVAQKRRDLTAAEALTRQGIALRRELSESDGLHLARDLNQLAVILHHQGRFEAAEGFYRESFDIRQQRLPEAHPDRAESLHNLGSLASSAGDPATAEGHFRKALALLERAFGDEHPRIAAVLNNLAGALMAQGRLDEASVALLRAVSIRRHNFGEAHPEVALGWNNLAVLSREREDLAAAEQYSLRAVDVAHQVHGPDHPLTAAFENNRATVLAALGRVDEAERVMRRVLEQRRRTLDPDHPFFGDSFLSLGQLLVETGRAGEGEPLLRRALDLRRAAYPADHWRVGEAASALGACLLALDQREAAAPLLRSGHGILQATRGDGARSTRIASRRLAGLSP